MSTALNLVQKVSKVQDSQLKLREARVPKKASAFTRAFLSSPEKCGISAEKTFIEASTRNPYKLRDAAKKAKWAIQAGATSVDDYVRLGRMAIAARDTPRAINVIGFLENNGNMKEANYLLGHFLYVLASSKHDMSSREFNINPYGDAHTLLAKEAKELYNEAEKCFAAAKQSPDVIAMRAWINAVLIPSRATNMDYFTAVLRYEELLSEIKPNGGAYPPNRKVLYQKVLDNLQILKDRRDGKKPEKTMVFLDTYAFLQAQQ